MLDVNVPNVLTIALISLIVIAVAKAGLHFAGKDTWAQML